MFLGLDFFSGKYSMLPQPIATQEMDKIFFLRRTISSYRDGIPAKN